MFGITQRCGLRINSMGLLADVGGAQKTKPFGVGGHDAVLNSVVHHLDEVTAPAWPAVQISLFGRTAYLLASRCLRYIADARCNGFEERIEVFHGRVRAADHHAVSSLQAPNTAARTNIHVVDALRREFLGATDIVDIVGI